MLSLVPINCKIGDGRMNRKNFTSVLNIPLSLAMPWNLQWVKARCFCCGREYIIEISNDLANYKMLWFFFFFSRSFWASKPEVNFGNKTSKCRLFFLFIKIQPHIVLLSRIGETFWLYVFDTMLLLLQIPKNSNLKLQAYPRGRSWF